MSKYVRVGGDVEDDFAGHGTQMDIVKSNGQDKQICHVVLGSVRLTPVFGNLMQTPILGSLSLTKISW